MKRSAPTRSSFTLPASEVKLVNRLKKKLHARSNTQVIRTTVFRLEQELSGSDLREQFAHASQMATTHQSSDMHLLDAIDDELPA